MNENIYDEKKERKNKKLKAQLMSERAINSLKNYVKI